MRALSGLNPEQENAVTLCDRHLLVVAGAGSGKTRVLTHKIAYLIEKQGLYPSQILAMTFSNKAAKEMKERVSFLLPSYEQPYWIGTFHSTCLKILKEFHVDANLPAQMSIYDESDQLSALKRILKERNIDPKKLSPKVIRYHLDWAKNETYNILPYLARSGELNTQGLEVAKRYQEILVENGALDFGDLLGKAVQLLREKPNVARILQSRWKFILIDEYQDTNQIQKDLILELAKGGATVVAVGDEDQSIYGWRGARVENILEFESDFPGSDIVKLEQNYRSTQSILEAANHVISNNRGRRSKRLWTDQGEGDRATFFLASDDYGEAQYVLDQIQKLEQTDRAKMSEVAIFYRTHVQSRLLEDECRRRNLSYKIFGGVRFYDRQEIKNALAFLMTALNPADRISFERIVNLPSRGIGPKSLDKLYSDAMARGIPIVDAIPYLSGSSKAESNLIQFHKWFCLFREKARNEKPAEVLEYALKESGYLQSLEDEGTIESDARIENLQELLRSMDEYYQETQGSVADYLDRISLVADTDQYEATVETMTLMTVHNSKGLEFDHVFVVGMEEGIFPHQRSIETNDRDEIEEERRLCYVAMTRARKRLFLTGASRRRLYKNTQYNPVSRFIAEIPSDYLIDLSEPEDSYQENNYTISHYSRRGLLPKQKKKIQPKYDEYYQPSYDDLEESNRGTWGKAARAAEMSGAVPPGTQVMHPQFGLGTVQKCEGSKDNPKLTVQFKNVGVKKLLLNYCSLDIVKTA